MSWAGRAKWLGLGLGAGLLLALGLYVLLLGRVHWSTPQQDLPEAWVEMLEAEGRLALATEDIPVAALLVYRGQVIGRGHNRVRANKDAGAHAEIEALSDAMAQLGVDGFTELQASELELISTFEPCPMCQGALVMWGVRKVTYLKDKTVGRQLQLERLRLEHLWNRRQMRPVDLQETLFQLHPRYPGRTRTATAGP